MLKWKNIHVLFYIIFNIQYEYKANLIWISPMILKEFDESSVHIEIWLQMNTMVAKIIRTLVFPPAKKWFQVSYFCLLLYCVSKTFWFTFILPLIVIIQWDFCLTAASAPHRDLIWSDHHHQSVWNDMKKQNKLRQTKSRRTVAVSSRCFKKHTWKVPWKTLCKCTEGKSCFKRKWSSHQTLISFS